MIPLLVVVFQPGKVFFPLPQKRLQSFLPFALFGQGRLQALDLPGIIPLPPEPFPEMDQAVLIGIQRLLPLPEFRFAGPERFQLPAQCGDFFEAGFFVAQRFFLPAQRFPGSFQLSQFPAECFALRLLFGDCRLLCFSQFQQLPFDPVDLMMVLPFHHHHFRIEFEALQVEDLFQHAGAVGIAQLQELLEFSLGNDDGAAEVLVTQTEDRFRRNLLRLPFAIDPLQGAALERIDLLEMLLLPFSPHFK